MKASILKRLDALEEAVSRHATPPLRFVDVTKFPDYDRDAYWDGDETILSRYAPPVPDIDPGTITTVVVTLNPDSRDVWEATRGMTDDEQDAYDDAWIRESERKEPEPVPDPEPEARYDWNGYPIID